MQGLEEVELLRTMMSEAIKEIVTEYQVASKEWFSLKEAAEYIGVSVNTLAKYREMGLKVCVIEGISRVSHKEINRFLEIHAN